MTERYPYAFFFLTEDAGKTHYSYDLISGLGVSVAGRYLGMLSNFAAVPPVQGTA